MATIRLTDGRVVNKHYDLVGRDDLDALLDELAELITDNRLPSAAVVVPPNPHP
ncbi:hypothetical protein J5X84_27245 [Streptosporangiaceae bacterium NEAU-GS5]|nr:hypothetical protein [Streptosporangiaceae bacterium NEAU-GS5]